MCRQQDIHFNINVKRYLVSHMLNEQRLCEAFQKTASLFVKATAYLNGLIITGVTEEKHWNNLERLIKKRCEYGLCIKLTKSVFCKECVEYLGHIIDKDGKRPS